MTIPLDFILVDYDFNARKVGENGEYENIDTLAKQIKQDGQLSPILVRRLSEEDAKEYEGKTFELIFGFRRFAAMEELGMNTIQAQIWDGDETDAYFVNLAENISRDNLKPWEKAQRYVEMKQDFEISAAKIATRLGIPKSQVAALCKILEKGSPKIVQLWKDKHPRAGTDSLNRYVVKDGFSHDEQWDAWLKHCGLQSDTPDPDPKANGAKKAPKAERVIRPTPKQLENGLSAISDNETREKEWLTGCAAGLKWALGKTKTLPGVYDQRKKAKPEKENEAE